MVKREISWRIYLTAAFITFVIFLGGLWLGFFLSNEKYQIINNDLEELQIEQRDIEFEIHLLNSFGTESCETLDYEIRKTGKLASDLGEKVTLYETDTIRDGNFDTLKKNYMLTLIQFWSYWETFKKNCNSTVNTVLYFYSAKECSDCQAQGHVLSFLKKRYPEDIMVFALDINENLYSLNLLKNIYNISITPTMIINNEKYEGLLDSKALEELFTL